MLRSWNNINIGAFNICTDDFWIFLIPLSSNNHIFHTQPFAFKVISSTVSLLIVRPSVSSVLNIQSSPPIFLAYFSTTKFWLPFDSIVNLNPLILYLFIVLHLLHVLIAFLSQLKFNGQYFNSSIGYIFNSSAPTLQKPNACWLGWNLSLLPTCIQAAGLGWRKMYNVQLCWMISLSIYSHLLQMSP